ncbi:type ISP restriction/modification enzyme [Lyngbya sp. PCC 8106]|uniref:type ISP restriction/modification enzyme n=1 Tax=Lyngbya sp. (strain PCC 8106) TaxID=313612 RepID=UPI0000EABA1C|nr:type ISP restriction/modification enzyme [Lyngbya sp. PCC 8106]EAW33326.1 helicase domain protein [Lyngbya sp. PCC 8106]
MKKAKIYYARMDEFWRKEEKLDYLEKLEHIGNVEWEDIQPDKNHTWLTGELEDDFGDFIAIGNKSTKEGLDESAIFINYSIGVQTSRDSWAYNFTKNTLIKNIQAFINTYNEQTYLWNTQRKPDSKIDDFVLSDETKIKWSSRLKQCLAANQSVEFCPNKIRNSLYRPFSFQYLYFDEVLNHRRGQFPLIFPTPETEEENQVICLPGIGNRQAFGIFISKLILSLDFAFEKAQCFPFYTYDEDGTNRQENITDWALEQFRNQYQDPKISKWDIFHYTYAILHHPDYRKRYAANLKRELSRIPFAPEFHPFATAGKRLADIHINYEQQPEYRLKHLENKDLPIDWRVEKMRFSKDGIQLKYNDFLTLTGIPPEVFEYRLGNRSALDWIIDQYKISTDKRSGITNDPNRLDDEEYIVRLIKKVITVSLETVKIVKNLPYLGLPND